MRKTLQGKRRIINGRRGSFQLLFALVYLVLGASFILTEPLPSRVLALAWLGEFVPYVGYVWVVGAVLAMTGMHLPRGRDSYSFSALAFAPLLFGGFFLIGMFFGAPLVNGLVSTAVYWLIGATVMVVSGMQGEHDRCARTPTHEP